MRMSEELTSSYALVSKLQDDCEAKEDKLVRVREMVTPRTRDKAGLGALTRLTLPPLSTDMRERLKKADDETRGVTPTRGTTPPSVRHQKFSIFSFKKVDTEREQAQTLIQVEDQALIDMNEKVQNEIDKNLDIMPGQRCSL